MQMQQFEDARQYDLPWHSGSQNGAKATMLLGELDRIMTVMQRHTSKT